MTETLANWFVENLGAYASPPLIVFLVSLLPLLELRGGIIVGYALGMELAPSFVISYIGNILPIPFILLFIKFIFKALKKTFMRGFVEWCENRADSKSDSIRKYAYWGVFLFVAIPLPGTGAWMGALIASMLNMDVKKSFIVILAGVLVAGIIVSLFSYGLLDAILRLV